MNYSNSIEINSEHSSKTDRETIQKIVKQASGGRYIVAVMGEKSDIITFDNTRLACEVMEELRQACVSWLCEFVETPEFEGEEL